MRTKERKMKMRKKGRESTGGGVEQRERRRERWSSGLKMKKGKEGGIKKGKGEDERNQVEDHDML